MQIAKERNVMYSREFFLVVRNGCFRFCLFEFGHGHVVFPSPVYCKTVQLWCTHGVVLIKEQANWK